MKTLAWTLAVMVSMSAGAAAAADSAWPTLDAKTFAAKTPDAKMPDAKAQDTNAQDAGPLESDAGYAKVCDAYGEGFSYSPGTDTCIKVGGYIKFGTSIHGGSSNH